MPTPSHAPSPPFAPRRRLAWVFAWIAALALGVTVLAPAVHAGDEVEVTVRKGDTLGRIAKRNGVSVAELRKWNRGRIGRNDMLRLGTKLRVRSPEDIAKAAAAAQPEKGVDGAKGAAKAAPMMGDGWADAVVVRRGDSLGRIAEREGVALSSLMAWNGLSERSKLAAGQELLVMRQGQRPKARSVGRPTEGTLAYGQRLEAGTGYRLRFPKHTFALDSVVKSIRACTKKTKESFPGTADILVGELSRAGGGRFPPHQSHQSGRDADIGYYLASNEQNATMHRVKASDVDYAKTWALLRCLVTTDQVSRVYMDKAIQASMAEWLRQKKAMSEDELARLFGVLGGDAALVRHAAKHDTHFHVRFSCDADQTECVEEEDEAPFKL